MYIRSYLREASRGAGKGSLIHYLLKNGHLFPNEPLTDEEQALFQDMDFGQFKLRECYYNAQTLLLNLDDSGPVKYAEGMASNASQIPTLHAWLSVNGKVVDPTWGRFRMAPEGLLQVVRLNHIMGTLPAGWEYWGVELPSADVAAAMVAHKASISLLDDYECGWPLLTGSQRHPRWVAGHRVKR